MDFQQIRKYVKGVLTNSFLNKTTLDKLSTSNKGNLLFDGKEINSSSVKWNQIQTEGIKIAEVTIDGMATEIFAPNGGIGSGIVIDTLIDATITTTDSYDFSASIDNYDMLLVTGMTHINSSDYEQLNSLIIMKDDYYIEAVDGWSHSLNFSINGSTRRAVFNFNAGKLNVVKIENAALKKIYGIKFVSQQHEYSTEEKVVGTWIDGKPIYEFTYYNETPVVSSTYNDFVSTGVTLNNIDNIININGTVIRDIGDGKLCYPIAYESNDYKLIVRPHAIGISNDYDIKYCAYFSSNSIKNIVIIIQYTKTTD